VSRSVLVFGGQALLKLFPQFLPASPWCAAGDQPPEDQDGGDQDYEFGVFQEFRKVEHGGGIGWVGELDCITGWFGLVFS